MSPETQRKLKLTERQVDFDEMLQLDEGTPRHEQLRRKLGATKGKPVKRNPALVAIESTTS